MQRAKPFSLALSCGSPPLGLAIVGLTLSQLQQVEVCPEARSGRWEGHRTAAAASDSHWCSFPRAITAFASAMISLHSSIFMVELTFSDRPRQPAAALDGLTLAI
jgi:hypothetical protein